MSASLDRLELPIIGLARKVDSHAKSNCRANKRLSLALGYFDGHDLLKVSVVRNRRHSLLRKWGSHLVVLVNLDDVSMSIF
jgi:hypothetical protein